MDIAKFYQSTLIQRDEPENSVTFISLPRDSIQSIKEPSFDDLSQKTGFKPLHEIMQPSDLPDTLTAALLLSESQISKEEKIKSYSLLSGPDKYKSLDLLLKNRQTSTYAFAEYVTYSRSVPVEHTPLEAESIATMVVSGTGAGYGAYAGFLITGTIPIIFILIPTGMIFFGDSAGIAYALQEGLRDGLYSLLTRISVKINYHISAPKAEAVAYESGFRKKMDKSKAEEKSIEDLFDRG